MVGIKEDGTVYSCPESEPFSMWDDVDRIEDDVVGITHSGKVLPTWFFTNEAPGIKTWEDITSFNCDGHIGYGLKADGTILCTSPDIYTEKCDNAIDISSSGLVMCTDGSFRCISNNNHINASTLAQLGNGYIYHAYELHKGDVVK